MSEEVASADSLRTANAELRGALDVALAELDQRRARERDLLLVALEAYHLSLHIAEFDSVVDGHDVDRLDVALLKALHVDHLFDFMQVGEAIETLLGGYEAAQLARAAIQKARAE
jgi:hypothetical protein